LIGIVGLRNVKKTENQKNEGMARPIRFFDYA
jgi:hypothetical protein